MKKIAFSNMKTTPLKFLLLLASLVLGSCAAAFAQDTTYIWQSADGDPFNIQGTIVLDSPSSANGSASDVVSLTITDTVDTYSWTPATLGGPQGLFLGTTFAWNPSRVVQMDIYTPGYGDNPDAAFETHPNGTGAIFDFSVLQPPADAPGDQSGEWVAPGTVPEPSTVALLLFAGAMLVAARRSIAAARRPASAQRGNRFD